jgi:two-component system sensor histidine kinase KdpD
VTKIVAGKTAQPRWRQWISNTIVDELLKKSGDVDIYVVSGEGDSSLPVSSGPAPPANRWTKYAAAATVVATCGGLGWIARQFDLAEANIVMIFLAGVAIVAARWGRMPSIAAAVLGVLVFDFFFVPPQLTFAVSDTQYVITFAVMLGIGLVISELTSRLKTQLRASQQQERRTAELFRMTRQLSELSGSDFLARTAGRQLQEIFDGEVVLFLREDAGTLSLRFGEKTSIASQPINEVVAQWVANHGKTAGRGTDTLPNATALFVPLAGSQQVVGALGVAPREPERFLDPEQVRLLETCGSLIALSIERDQSVLQAHEAQVQVQTEQLRNSLLNSVSHDLRTPLATIAGCASSLAERCRDEDREMLESIVDESRRLTRLVENLLDMARLDSGSISINRQWQVLEEIVGLALEAVRRELAEHKVRLTIPEDFPLIHVDGFLLEQLLVNLLENASRYTPAGSEIDIGAQLGDRSMEVRVSDNGPGLPAGSEVKVFDKFFRGSSVAPDGRRGVGLGLAICRAIALAHGGKISARNRPQGGAEFTVVIPQTESPPEIVPEPEAVSASA